MKGAFVPRTDQHQSALYRLLDPRLAREMHDHRVGDCDLLPVGEWVRNPPGWRAVRCRWDLRLSEYYEHGICGCGMCTGQFDRKWKARRRRYAARQEIRDAINDLVLHSEWDRNGCLACGAPGILTHYGWACNDPWATSG
jgi:hypothetical protein